MGFLRQLAELQQVQHTQQDVLASARKGTLLLDGNLRIQHLSPVCIGMLDRYFDWQPTAPRPLPARFQGWLANILMVTADTLAETRPPLVIEGASGRLHIRITEHGSAGTLLLLSEHSAELATPGFKEAGLSAREAEVCRWLAAGQSNGGIARIPGISPRTVEKHVAQILTKLGVENRAAAVARALELARP